VIQIALYDCGKFPAVHDEQRLILSRGLVGDPDRIHPDKGNIQERSKSFFHGSPFGIRLPTLKKGTRSPDWNSPGSCLMIVPIILFVIGLVLLLKGGSFTVRGAEGLALRLGVAPATIGFTIVAFGTSLPELVVTTEAFSRGEAGIGFGNIVGSNIANIGLILGLIALLRLLSCSTSPSSRKNSSMSILMVLLGTAVFVLFSLRGVLDTLSGVVFLGLFSLILFSTWKSGPEPDPPGDPAARPLLLTIAGLASVIIGSHLLLTGAVEIALAFSISPLVIGLSLVAVGTSLPELATSLVAAMKNSQGIALGNVLGSNIFNLLFIRGINSLATSIPIPDQGSLIALSLFTAGLVPFLLWRPAITRIAGGALLGAYILYITLLFLG
jgi:cation:H+ antiporter